MSGMTSQERVRRLIDHEETDRLAKRDTIWGATEKLWHEQGLPEGVTAAEYFEFEVKAIGADMTPRFPIETLDENEEYITETTSWGGVRRNHKDRSTTPEVIDTPVKCRADWEKIKPRLEPDATRVNWDAAEANYRTWREAGEYITFTSPSGYDNCQSIVNSERLLMMMGDDPELVREIMTTHSALVVATFEMMVERGFEFDAVWMFNDMGYRNGPLFSPRMYRDIVMPGEKMIYDAAHARGMQALMHSCGNIMPLLPHVIEAGVDCWQSMEVKAGVDVRELKDEYGDAIAFFGNINVMAMEEEGTEAIEEEIRTKFDIAMPGGGYLYHSDHSIPTDVSFERYQYVMQLVAEYGSYE